MAEKQDNSATLKKKKVDFHNFAKNDVIMVKHD